jgi:hypothetical protein
MTLPGSVVIAATAIAVLTSCGAQAGNPAGGGGRGTASPPGTGTSAGPTPTPTPAPTSARPTKTRPADPVGTPSGPTLVLDGVAVPGVEAGCVVFSTGGQSYLLLGATGPVPTEVPIRVRGIVLTGVLSYCQQGTPLKVLEINRR